MPSRKVSRPADRKPHVSARAAQNAARHAKSQPTSKEDGPHKLEDLPHNASPDPEHEQAMQLDSSDEDDENNGETARPYATLLQALSRSRPSHEPPRKRRKLDIKDNISRRPPQQSGEIDAEVSNPHVHDGNGGAQTSNAVESNPSEEALEENSDNDSVEEESSNDPFDSHLSDGMLDRLNEVTAQPNGLQWSKEIKRSPSQSKNVFFLPTFHDKAKSELFVAKEGYLGLHIKPKLIKNLDGRVESAFKAHSNLAALMFGYKDILCNDRTVANGLGLQQVYCTHALNHVLKTRDRVVRNNSKLVKIGEAEDVEYRDQGFTRPKVLFLLPTRQACVRLMDTITSILEPEQQENRKRFYETFSQSDDLSASDKPNDFKELFSGNDDDRFMIGLKITRKTIKYFSSFYTADMIIASPLGLQAKITAADKKKRDWDFLSSIELVVIDQADALYMQNWENVEAVMNHLNLEPKEAHGCDFTRVRRWYLDKMARHYRQTLVFSAYGFPEANALFERLMVNIDGKVKVMQNEYVGALGRLGVQAKQSFVRFHAISAAQEPEARFKYFTASVVPVLSKIARNAAENLQGTLIFIPSYMDFLRIQNFFCYSNESQSITFDPGDLPCISEYASKAQNARAKSLFQTGRHPVLLYTGRSHHFYRYKIRGVRRVVMYGLPGNPEFYLELVGGYLGRSVSEGRFSPDEVYVQSLFCKYDTMKLERIVGSRRAVTMIKEKGDIFDFF